MSDNIPEYLKFLEVYKYFQYLKNYQSEILHWDNALYLSDVKTLISFQYLLNIIRYLQTFGENITNKKIYTSEISKETFDDINMIFKISTELKDTYKKLISEIIYEDEYKIVNNLKFYKFNDKQLLRELINKIDLNIKNLYYLVNNFCSIIYYDPSQTINVRNSFLFTIMENIMKKYGIQVDDFEDKIIDDYESYLYYENYLQSLIYYRLYLNDKNNLTNEFDILINYVSKYIPSFESEYLIDQILKLVNKLENNLLKNINFGYFIKDPLISNNCLVFDAQELKKMIKIIYTNYILRYDNSDFAEKISKNLYDKLLAKKCKIDIDDLTKLIYDFSDDFSYIFFLYSVMFVMVNDNTFFYKKSSLINSFTSIIGEIIKNKNFFIYIKLLKKIYKYKKLLIENGLIDIEINDDINELLQKCYLKLFDENIKLRDVLIDLKDNILLFSNNSITQFIYNFFLPLLNIVDVSSEDVKNTEEFELFENIRIKYVENEDEIKIRSSKDLNYYLYYLADIKKLKNYEKNDKGYLLKAKDNDAIIYGDLRISKSNYYEIPKGKISMISFTKLKLKINNLNKNVIFLGEFHTKNELNYQYIQNELYKCNKENKFLEFLLEMNIHLFYLPKYQKKFNNYYDGVFNLTKFSNCVDDKNLRNIYSNIPKENKDNLFCFTNVWYQNIDYRSADMIFSYIFNSNFNNRSKERILLEKSRITDFEDFDKLYIGYFYQMNILNFINNTVKNFIINDKYFLFGNVYEFSKNDPLYQVIEKVIDMNIFKSDFKNQVFKISYKFNKKILKYEDAINNKNIVVEPYLYYLNLYMTKDTPLYEDLYNKSSITFSMINNNDINEFNNIIDQLTVFDIYRMIVYQMCDYYNYIYNTYINFDENKKNFILTDPINIYGYRSFQFLNNFTTRFDKNGIKNIICSYLLREVNYRGNFYDDYISLFTHYHPVFSRFVYYYKSPDIMVRDSFIDMNILNRIFFDYDVEDKISNNFPERCKNIVLYAGNAHCSILMIYLTNCLLFPRYSNLLQYDLVIDNYGKYQGPLISNQDYKHIYFQNYNNTDIILPSIVDNLEV